MSDLKPVANNLFRRHSARKLANLLAESFFNESELSKQRDHLKSEVERLRGRCGELEEALQITRANMADWASYVDAYFLDKHDFDGDMELAAKALQDRSQHAWLLRKQAEAVEDCVKQNKTVYLTDYAGRMIGHCNDYAQRLRQQAAESERGEGDEQ